ncbi:MAG: response regulator [Hyphomicrobium sp.]|nr:response regulator [Hyphomicrobium sp.]
MSNKFPAKVLLVDDDPIHLEIVAAHCRARGASTVWTAANGREAQAVVAAQGTAIDLIVTDLNMPEFDGIELMSGLAEKGVGTAVVIVTGAAAPVAAAARKMAALYGLNFRGLLKKPFAPADLDTLLKSA